jgi:hypothetical protein
MATSASVNKNYKHNTAYIANNQGSLLLTLPFSPNELEWSYTLNKVSFDTYGGRVTQLLSVAINQMSLQADAGSRQNLLNIYTIIMQMQEDQIVNRLPLILTIPADSTLKSTTIVNGHMESSSIPITLYLWFSAMQIGFDPTTVTYPYIMSFNVADESYPNYPGPNSYNSLSKVITEGEIAGIFAKSAGSNEIDFGTTSSLTYAGLKNLTSAEANKKKRATRGLTFNKELQDVPNLGAGGATP